jgi:Domain of unknown function (DUF4350)
MPAGIAPSDRKILLIGGSLLALLLTISVIFSPPGDEPESRVPSTYSSQSDGAEAAYLLLAKLHYPVRRWEQPPNELLSPANGILLILAEPTDPPSEKERTALKTFVLRGGRVLFTGSNLASYFPEASLSHIPPDPDFHSYSPNIPSGLARGAQHVSIRPQSYWDKLDSSQLLLYGNPDSAAVISWRLGAGRIIWWAGSTPLTNAGLTREDNLHFFLNVVADWTGEGDYSILWDEYFHGQRASLWSYVARTSLAWGFLQLGLLAVAVLFTFSRRSGPTYTPAGISRLSPLEFVDTLGGLYERAGAASSAVAVSYQRFRALLNRQLGLPSNTPNETLAVAAEQRLGWRNQGLGMLLSRAEVATRVEKLPPREALDLVQQLELLTAKLDVRTQSRLEKT